MDILLKFVISFLNLLSFAIVVRVLLSWFGNLRNQFTELIAQVTDPIMLFFRKYIPPIGMIDISPIVAIFAIEILIGVLRNLF